MPGCGDTGSLHELLAGMSNGAAATEKCTAGPQNAPQNYPGSAMLLLGVHRKELKAGLILCAHSSTIHSSRKVQTAQDVP